MRLSFLRAADRTPAPWKNGGGVTFEIAAFPEGAGLAAFDWRVSVAQVAAGGSFSRFEGVDRLMLVLDGRLELDVAGERLGLDERSPAAAFAGEAEVNALPPAAPVTDLNVMVRRGVYTATLERRGAATAGVVCQDITLVLCPAQLNAAVGARRCHLAPGDVLRIEAARGLLARLKPETAAEVIVAHINAVR
ncbi:MAG TPA: HutD family protein [Caulobacteraceae bacterium]|jgi:hypothetical protein|nr:HutD family protein [Caulobacteraceae bacterium]